MLPNLPALFCAGVRDNSLVNPLYPSLCPQLQGALLQTLLATRALYFLFPNIYALLPKTSIGQALTVETKPSIRVAPITGDRAAYMLGGSPWSLTECAGMQLLLKLSNEEQTGG
jgi:hypothetical protein